MASQAQEKLRLGLERLNRAGNDADVLGSALQSLHGALEDQFRDRLCANSQISPDQSSRIQNKQTQWKELIELMQQYEGLSDRDRHYILNVNRLRNEFAHGGEYQGSRAQVEDYANYVEQIFQQYAGRSSYRAGGFQQNASSHSTAYAYQAASYPVTSRSQRGSRLYDPSVCLQWMIAHLVGLVLSAIYVIVGILLLGLVFAFWKSSEKYDWIAPVVVYAFSSLGFGTAQQGVVSSRLSDGTQWAGFTAIGGLLSGCLLSGLFSHIGADADLTQELSQRIAENTTLGIMTWAAFGAVTGLLIGFMQWIILSSNSTNARIWIWANLVESSVFWGGFPLLGIALFGPKPEWSEFLIFLAGWGATCRLITGTTLARLRT